MLGATMMAEFDVKKRAYANIEARFACPHVNREIRYRIIKDGRPTYVSQCVRCGNTSTPIKAAVAKRQASAIPEYDYDLEQKWRAAKSLAYDAVRKTIKPQLKAEYEAYLRSSEWKALREQVFRRCSEVCELCEEAAAEEVHHLTYERIGHEELSDLMGVCKPCHELIHGPRST